MDRRTVIQNVALLLGGSIVGGSIFTLQGCKSEPKVNKLFTQAQIDLMDEIAETILPKTKTPGAKEAKVGAFMSIMVIDCYTEKDQKVFMDGLETINKLSKDKNNAEFMKATPEQRLALLVALDKEQKEYQKTKKNDEPSHYFRMMKELTLTGFFTSKEGAEQALRYVAVPGRYDGSYPYKKGDRAFAT
ncbi:MAG: gluconate 2-dehydrogenase subunit 3 family protein [Chitinophagaceae bacterium]